MSQPDQQSVAQPDDVTHWVGRVKNLVDKPETLTGPGPAGAQPWHNRTLGCFDPIDTCKPQYYNMTFTHSLTDPRLVDLLLPMRHLWENPPPSQQGCFHAGLLCCERVGT
jgi:hypothetical protein